MKNQLIADMLGKQATCDNPLKTFLKHLMVWE